MDYAPSDQETAKGQELHQSVFLPEGALFQELRRKKMPAAALPKEAEAGREQGRCFLLRSPQRNAQPLHEIHLCMSHSPPFGGASPVSQLGLGVSKASYLLQV